jgi:hypothetical protein
VSAKLNELELGVKREEWKRAEGKEEERKEREGEKEKR